jgi:hypothetical protein
MKKLTPKQQWILNYLKGVTCASEYELAKKYTHYLKPTQWDAFNMHTTLVTLMNRLLVCMERNPTTGFRYYSLF